MMDGDAITLMPAKLASALSKAQAEIRHAEKSAENPAFKRDGKPMKYATLADIWDAARAPLTKNGLCIVQAPRRTESGGVAVRTMLLHESGETYDAGELEMPGGNTAQAVGSAITYARRYSMAAIVGIAPDEDDDGAAASTGGGWDQRRERPRDQPRPRPEPTRADAPIESKDDDLATNTKELRDACQSLASRLRRHTGKNVAALRKGAGVPENGSLDPMQLLRFVNYCKRELANYEDPEPDDLPAWSLSSEEPA